MGASAWEYAVPYQADLGAALAALRRQVFDAGDYLKPSFYGVNGGPLGVPDPGSLDDLYTEPYWEYMGTSGTHSVIDVNTVVPADDVDDFGTVRPLRDYECVLLFGTDRPGRQEYEALAGSERLLECVTERWTGRAVVLWKDGQPAEIVFWGYSGA